MIRIIPGGGITPPAGDYLFLPGMQVSKFTVATVAKMPEAAETRGLSVLPLQFRKQLPGSPGSLPASPCVWDTLKDGRLLCYYIATMIFFS